MRMALFFFEDTPLGSLIVAGDGQIFYDGDTLLTMLSEVELPHPEQDRLVTLGAEPEAFIRSIEQLNNDYFHVYLIENAYDHDEVTRVVDAHYGVSVTKRRGFTRRVRDTMSS